MINLATGSHIISVRLSNKSKQKYGTFAKFSLAVIWACEVTNNPQIFLTRENQHIQETNRHFGGTLNHYGPMVFVENQQQNESYTFNYILL